MSYTNSVTRKTRTVKDILHFLTMEQMAAEIVRLDAIVRELHLLQNGVKATVAEGQGHWRPCSGCYETNEGYPVGPHSTIFGCDLGGGCSECGGLGVIWDDTDYDALADFMANADQTSKAQLPDQAPLSADELATFEQATTEFEEYNETSVDYPQLMRFASMDLLRCTWFEPTEEGQEALRKARASKAEGGA